MFQKFLVFNPKDYLSYLYLAKIYKEEDNKNETEKNLNTTLLLNPKNEEALFMLIELQLERSNFSKAKELNEKFLLICSKLCKNKSQIAQKIKNLQHLQHDLTHLKQQCSQHRTIEQCGILKELHQPHECEHESHQQKKAPQS